MQTKYWRKHQKNKDTKKKKTEIQYTYDTSYVRGRAIMKATKVGGGPGGNGQIYVLHYYLSLSTHTYFIHDSRRRKIAIDTMWSRRGQYTRDSIRSAVKRPGGGRRKKQKRNHQIKRYMPPMATNLPQRARITQPIYKISSSHVSSPPPISRVRNRNRPQ